MELGSHRRHSWALAALLGGCAHEVAPPASRPAPPASAALAVGDPALPGAAPATNPVIRVAEDPTPPSEPAYDLESDLARRAAEARGDFGQRAVVTTVADRFVLVAPRNGPEIAQAVEVTKLALQAYLNGRFATLPARALSVYLFSSTAPYEAYCQRRWGSECGTPFGFYRYDERRIVMNVGPGIGTLTHELVHPLVEADFPEAPDWINEGIASLFEQPYLGRRGEIHGGKNWRHPRLMQAFNSASEREHATLPALFAMSDQEFRGDRETLNYAAARYFCQWLDHQHLLWPFFQRWRATRATDRSGEQAFREVVGKTPEQANDDWVRWVRRL